MRARIDAYLAVLTATLYAMVQATWLTLAILLISRFVLPLATDRAWQDIDVALPELSPMLWLLVGPFVLLFAGAGVLGQLTSNLALIALLYAGVFLGCVSVCVTSVRRIPSLAATSLLRRSGEHWLTLALASAELDRGEHALHGLRRDLWSRGLRPNILVNAIAESVVYAARESTRLALLRTCTDKVSRLRRHHVKVTALAFALSVGCLGALQSWAESAPAQDAKAVAPPLAAEHARPDATEQSTPGLDRDP